jgi:hypothetical protein
MILKGDYAGADKEPSFNGTITANLYIDGWKEMSDDEDKEFESSDKIMDKLYVAKFSDGSKSAIVSYKSNGYYGEWYGDSSLELTAKNSKIINCSLKNQWTSNKFKHTVECKDENGSEVKIKAFGGEGRVILVNGYRVKSAWLENNQDFYIYTEETDDKPLKDFKSITISDRKVKTLDDFNADITFSGTITHGNKKISATAGEKHKGSSKDRTLFAKDVTITDGTNTVSLEALHLTTKKEENKRVNQNGFGNYEVYYDDYDENEEEQEFSYVKIKNLVASIKDKDSNSLSLKSDLSYAKSGSNIEIKFRGEYSYSDTTFEGIVDVSGYEAEGEFIGGLDVSGKISSRGFEPFGIAVTALSTAEETSGYVIFARGKNEAYKLGINFSSDNNETNITIADVNGVRGKYTIKNDEEPTSYALTDKNDKELATIQKGDNDWEIKYTDGVSESIY